MPINKRHLKSVKMILPALTEATSPFWRPIKNSLFPPLGLATLAAYLDPDADISLQDEHVEKLDLDNEPDLVIIQVYITNAYRAYEIADHYRSRGSYVVLGGLHVTSLPEEAAQHADTIFRLPVPLATLRWRHLSFSPGFSLGLAVASGRGNRFNGFHGQPKCKNFGNR